MIDIRHVTFTYTAESAHGEIRDLDYVGDMDISTQPLYQTAGAVGSVFQNPRSQFFNVDTTSEITFGCENLGMPEAEDRVCECIGYAAGWGCGLWTLLSRSDRQ